VGLNKQVHLKVAQLGVLEIEDLLDGNHLLILLVFHNIPNLLSVLQNRIERGFAQITFVDFYERIGHVNQEQLLILP
jgi:hypothetical protein